MRANSRLSKAPFSARPEHQKLSGYWGALRRHGAQVFRIITGYFFLLGFLLAGLSSGAVAEVIVIGHESWGTTDVFDKNMMSRIYTGRIVQVAGMSVQPVNMKTGDVTRAVFIKDILRQSDDDYVAYWIVRRAIGKGAPPVEMNTVQEMIDFVRSTPGAIGYIDASQLRPGIKTLLTLP